jgi:hypothetical protein
MGEPLAAVPKEGRDMSRLIQVALLEILGVVLTVPAYSSVVDLAPRVETNFSTGWLYVPRDVPGGEKADLSDCTARRKRTDYRSCLTILLLSPTGLMLFELSCTPSTRTALFAL